MLTASADYTARIDKVFCRNPGGAVLNRFFFTFISCFVALGFFDSPEPGLELITDLPWPILGLLMRDLERKGIVLRKNGRARVFKEVRSRPLPSRLTRAASVGRLIVADLLAYESRGPANVSASTVPWTSGAFDVT